MSYSLSGVASDTFVKSYFDMYFGGLIELHHLVNTDVSIMYNIIHQNTV